MQKAIIGKKLGMTQLFNDNGIVVPVTVIEAGPCAVSQVKTMEADGYESVQMGFGDLKAHKVTKPMKGHFAKADVAPKRVLREFKMNDMSAFNVGDLIKADAFAEGDKVDVCGISKGKGYAGVIKRHGFARLKMSHGTGPVARHGGSLGPISDPSRVYKNKKMAGHMGAVRSTIQNLEIVKVDAEKNIIAIKGAVPGPKGGVVVITDSVKSK